MRLKKLFIEIGKESFGWFTTVVNDFDFLILKRGFHRAVRKYDKDFIKKVLEDTRFWDSYEGVGKGKSALINKILEKAILSGEWVNKEKVVRRIMALGVDIRQAEMIAVTELANFANRVREEIYKNETRVRYFRYVTEGDYRVCELCKEVARRTSKGVSLERLREIIHDVTKGKARGYQVHPLCRCAIVRAYMKEDAMRPWEKGKAPSMVKFINKKVEK